MHSSSTNKTVQTHNECNCFVEVNQLYTYFNGYRFCTNGENNNN